MPIAIVAFWLIMVGILLYREALLPYLYRDSIPIRTVQSQDIWLGLYFGEEQRVGFVHLRTLPKERNGEQGYAMNVLAHIEIPLFVTNTHLQLVGNAWQSATAGLREFNFNINADGHSMRLTGTAENGVISGFLETGGEQNPFTLPVGENVLLSGSMGLGSLSLPALEPGDIIYTDAFDPTIMSVNKAKVEALRRETLNIAGERIDTIVIATTIAGFTTLAWISADSEVVRAEPPVGLIIKKITPEEAVAPMEAEESANMLNALSITPSGLIPNPDAKTLHMRITSDDPKLLPPEDTRQRYEKDLFIITRQNPDKESYTEALSDEEKARNLSSDLFIQANHPRILETAKDIIGEAKTSWEKSVRLHSWIYENISKKHVLSIPSALDVLEQRSGDCNEHAVLFTALSRSVGIPTRVVIGLAWSRTLQAFGYHAWVEIYAGHWIAMDPTFGEKVAGPTHIKLLTGSIDQWPRLLSYIDTLSIEIVKEEMDATTL